MIELDRHIELLLLDHDCVILPDFGGFVVHNEKAYIDETGVLYPPYRSVGFNVRLTVNDGLLVQSIMQTYDTDYPKALRMLEDEIKSIKKGLRQNGEWLIGSLGTLTFNNGITEFEPLHEGGIASPYFYGLDALELDVFTQKEEDIAKEEANFEAEELVLEAEVDEVEMENAFSVSSFTKSIMKYAAVLIGAIALFFATSIPVNNVNVANLNVMNGLMYAFPLQQAVQNTMNSLKGVTPVVDTIKVEDVEELVVAPAEKPVEVEHEQESAEVSVIPQKGQYTIILACQVMKVNADEFINRLNKDGFDEAKFMDLGNINYIVYSSFDSVGKAYSKLNELKKSNKAFESAWVLQVP